MIDKYLEILENDLYILDNSVLCECFRELGGLAFVRIGLTGCKTGFMRCFAHYADVFAKKWGMGAQTLHSKHIGYKYVFELMLRDDEIPIKYNYQYILDKTPNSQDFCDIIDNAFMRYWIAIMEAKMKNLESLADVAARVGDVRLTQYLSVMSETQNYVNTIAAEYTNNREMISLRKVHMFIFGGTHIIADTNCDEGIMLLLRLTVEREYEKQYHRFPAENRAQLNVTQDIWRLYGRHGLTLRLNCLNFTQIKSPSMRMEIKHYMKHHFSGAIRISDRTLSLLVCAANILYERNPNLRYFADIDDTDVRTFHDTLEQRVCKPSYIRSVFYACNTVVAYLMSDERFDQIRSPRPHYNPFDKYTFVNAEQYVKNTNYIPESVVKVLEDCIQELPDTDRLVFKIFAATGLRAKEIAMLEETCLESARYDGYVKLRYKQYKTLSARRSTGRSDYRFVYISEPLAEQISAQIRKTSELRKECGLPYIFINRYQNRRINMYNVSYFLVKVNKLIQKHGICGSPGVLWNFTSRQQRKTIAVNMIENGATVHDLAAQFGHLSTATAAKYYAEVRKYRLAEMNSEFFKTKFDYLISREQLAGYTEEERRLLYVDFRLGARRVEFGVCMKKLSEGGCDKRNRLYNCVNCRHLCTGKQYLCYWRELLMSQVALVEQLLDTYRRKNIQDYTDFIEYRQESRLMEAYRNVVQAILESEVRS